MRFDVLLRFVNTLPSTHRLCKHTFSSVTIQPDGTSLNNKNESACYRCADQVCMAVYAAYSLVSLIAAPRLIVLHAGQLRLSDSVQSCA